MNKNKKKGEGGAGRAQVRRNVRRRQGR